MTRKAFTEAMAPVATIPDIDGVIARHEVEALVARLGGRAPLQALGGRLINGGREKPLRAVITALERRFWRGDAELAQDLEFVLLGDIAPGRRSLTVKLDLLAQAMCDVDREMFWVLDLRDGTVTAHETARAPDPAFVAIPSHGRAGRLDMDAFISFIPDEHAQDGLRDAISARNAAMTFRRELERIPGLLQAWQTFRSEREAGRGREWLATLGLRAVRP